MNAATHLLSLYAIMAWTRKTLTLPVVTFKALLSITPCFVAGIPRRFYCECVLFQERQEHLCPLNFTMDVRERLYLMKRVMEEMFPIIRTVC